MIFFTSVIPTKDSEPLPSNCFQLIKPKENSALSWHTGTVASQQVFEKSGTVILTNAMLQSSPRGRNGAVAGVEYHGDSRPFGRPIPRPDQDTLQSDKGPGVVIETQTRPPLAGPYAFSRLPEPVDNLPKVRTHLFLKG